MSRLPSWASVFTIVVLPLVLFWSVLVGGRVLYWGTPLLQFYEWRQLVVDAYRAGHFPLWEQALGCGAPLLANLQSAALYPLNVLYFLVPIERAMGYSVVLHVILAGLFMYGFTRCIGLRTGAALLASVAYMMSGYLVSRAQFLSMVNGAAWLPLLFWLTHRIARKRRIADGLLLGMAIAVQLLAGHAQLWYYSLWAVGLYALFLGAGAALRERHSDAPGADDRHNSVWTAFGITLFALLVGLLAAAAQILPTAEMTLVSQRATGAGYDFAMNYSFWPWRLLTLASPDLFGNPAHGDFWGYGNYWEDCGYIGVLPLLLALAAIIVWLRRRGGGRDGVLSQVPFFGLLALAGLLLAMGKNLPIYPFVWQYVPGFGFFQAPARLLYWYTFGMAVLAGVGFQYLSGSERWKRVARYLIAISVSVLLTVAIGWLFLAGSTKLTFLGALAHTAVLTVVTAVLLLQAGRWSAGSWRRAWNASVIGFVAVDLLLFGLPLNPSAPADLYHWETRSGSFVRDAVARGPGPARLFSFERDVHDAMFERFFRFDTFGPVDDAHLHDLRESLLPNLAVVEDLESANNYDPLVVAYQQNLVDYVQDAPSTEAARLLRLMNVAYVAGGQDIVETPPVYAGDVDVYTIGESVPRAYIVHRSRISPDDATALSVLAGEGFDPRREVLLSPSEGGTSALLDSQTDGDAEAVAEVASLRYAGNGVTIVVALSRPGYLVLADTYYPGWRATVDGEEQRILRANYAFRAVALQAGRHEVEFWYDPGSFQWGLWISAVTWAGALLGLAAIGCRELQRARQTYRAGPTNHA